MSHDARAVANALIDRATAANQPLTPMQLIKLAYIAHGWILGLYSRPLFKQPVEAWRYGPVIKDIYQNVKSYGSSHVTEHISSNIEEFDGIENDLIDQVFQKYGSLSGIDLSRMTHAEGTPWHKVWYKHGQNSTIPTDMIEDHYSKKAKAAGGR